MRLANADEASRRVQQQCATADRENLDLQFLLDEARFEADDAVDRLRSELSFQIDLHRATVFRAVSLIRAVRAEYPRRWQRMGECLGIVKYSVAFRSLDRWSLSCDQTNAKRTDNANRNQTESEMQPLSINAADLETMSPVNLLSADGEDFVRLAYLTVLGREADDEGKAYYTDRLDRGHSKIEILDELRRSEEGKHRGSLTELDDILRRFRFNRLLQGKRAAGAGVERQIMRECSTVRVNHFMRYHDEEFVTQLFAYYLGRQADEAGYTHYLDLIRSGISRQQVLIDIARSHEARARGKSAGGEGRLAAALFIERIPIVRTVVTIVRFNLCLRNHLRELRALQNHLYRLSKNLR